MSGKPVEFHPEALAEAEAAVVWYRERSFRAAEAFTDELTKAVARATEVFGNEEAAFRWLGTPVAALDYATPISCLGTHQGAMRVIGVLTQIEHGVW